jgi:hypothetical protein
MKIPEQFVEKLKWAIYDWLGSISIKEIYWNRELSRKIEKLCKTLNKTI